MLRWTLTLVLAALVPAGVLVGCGESEEEKATSQVCAARDDISKQVKELQGLTLTTATTNQVRDNLQAIKDGLSTMSSAQTDLSEERRTELEKANQAFGDAVRDTAADVGRTLSIEDASTQLQSAFEGLAATYGSTLGKFDCS